MPSSLIYPDWPAPDCVKAVSTTRIGGFSLPPYDSFNLATHVGDDPFLVKNNRDYLALLALLPEQPKWLDQVQSNRVITSSEWQEGTQADAIISLQPSHVCSIMTADCLPVLLSNRRGTAVAAIHAGWRGLASGIIEQTVSQFHEKPSDIIAWLGPAIGPEQFEVGHDVYNAFSSSYFDRNNAFIKTDADHYLANIFLLAKQQLNYLGITDIYGGGHCTKSDSEQFFSYRRDNVTGRMATLIWFTNG
jgi:YfiH family protein